MGKRISKTILITVMLFVMLSSISVGIASGMSYTYHNVVRGDTFWILHQKYGVPMADIIKVNRPSGNTNLYVGEVIKIPKQGSIVHEIQRGETFWILSNKYGVSLNDILKSNNANYNTVLYPGDSVIIPQNIHKPTLYHINHTVKTGENFWNLGLKYGVPMNEIMKANPTRQSTNLYAGMVLRIPQYHIPIKPTPGARYGELLDWWTEAQYVWPMGKDAVIEDFYTGRRWNARRTIGANHADVEPLTAQDTAIMKNVWGGNWSWRVRPVIVIVDGRRLAASASAMPHDIQYIQNNNFNGHFDIHFLNSTRHSDGRVNESHQEAIRVSAGK